MDLKPGGAMSGATGERSAACHHQPREAIRGIQETGE
jgi:hypothetical protein